MLKREEAIKAVAAIEMGREGVPYCRTQEEFLADAAETVDVVLALLQPDDAMVERGAKALCGYGWEHSMTEEARQEYRDNARACLTAALKEGASG